MMVRAVLAILTLCTALMPIGATAGEAARVAAASDLKFALPALGKAFEAETGQTVSLTFGSSGQLAMQIENGAPFELFLSADEAFVQGLNAKGLTRDGGALYGLGRLSLFVPDGSPISADEKLDGLKAALAAGKITKFAIANPDHAPYGRAARAALQAAGLWTDLEPHLVRGESATQALQFALEGGADGALVPAPLVEAPEFTGKGQHVSVSPALVAPLRQRLVLTKSAGPVAAAFAAFITSENGRAILAKYGFSAPDGS